MSWDIYRVEREDFTEHVAWRVDLFQKAPDRSRPVRVDVALTLVAPDDGGLPGEAEREALAALREALEHDVVEATDGKYALRVTGGGRQVHSFYVPRARGLFRKRTGEALAAAAAAALEEEFPEHPLTVTHAEDEEWERFLDLFPSPDAVQWFSDVRALNALAVAGDDLAGPRAFTHTALLPSDDAREAFVAAAEAAGYEARERFDAAEDDPEHPFGVTVARAEPTLEPYVLHHRAILPLVAAAEAVEGIYSGWEAEAGPNAAAAGGDDGEGTGDDGAADDEGAA